MSTAAYPNFGHPTSSLLHMLNTIVAIESPPSKWLKYKMEVRQHILNHQILTSWLMAEKFDQVKQRNMDSFVFRSSFITDSQKYKTKNFRLRLLWAGIKKHIAK